MLFRSAVRNPSPVAWNATAGEVEKAIEWFENVGDVEVSAVITGDGLGTAFRYSVTYVTDLSADLSGGVGVANPSLVASDPGSAHGVTVCSDGGVVGSTCGAGDSATGTAALTNGGSKELTITELDAPLGVPFEYIIPNIVQASSDLEGFSVRVFAANAVRGYGMPSSPVVKKPMGVPDPPVEAELALVPDDSTALKVHWSDTGHDRASEVVEFAVRYTAGGSAVEISEPLSFFSSDRKVGDTGRWYAHTITNLVPGVAVSVEVMAINAMGVGGLRATTPSSERPRTATDRLSYGDELTLRVIPSSSAVTVGESCTSLRVEWVEPLDRGSAIDQYRIETHLASNAPFVAEVQVLTVSCASDFAGGTYTLGYNDDEVTDSTALLSDEDHIEVLLEALPSLRNVEVTRAHTSSSSFELRVTFLDDVPAASSLLLTAVPSGLLCANSADVATVSTAITTPGERAAGYAVVEVTGDARSYTLTDLAPGEKIVAMVSAQNDRGLALAQVSSAVAPPVQKPDVPLSVRVLVHSDSSLRVVWDAPASDGGSRVSRYRIEYDSKFSFDSGTTGPLGTHDHVVTSGPLDAVISGLERGTLYYVRLSAQNAEGFGKFSSQASEIPCSPPHPPEKLAVSMTGKGNLNLSWEASLDNGGCEIEGYTLAYDVVGPEAIGAGGTVFYSPHEVTVLRVTDSDSPDRSGTYRVAYDGHVTDEIPVDATAGELKNAPSGAEHRSGRGGALRGVNRRLRLRLHHCLRVSQLRRTRPGHGRAHGFDRCSALPRRFRVGNGGRQPGQCDDEGGNHRRRRWRRLLRV